MLLLFILLALVGFVAFYIRHGEKPFRADKPYVPKTVWQPSSPYFDADPFLGDR